MKRIFTLSIICLASISIFSQVPSYVPSSGLVSWWSFSGNANDDTGNGNNGTVNGPTLTTDRFGNSNGAYYFNGLSDYIIVPDNDLVDVQSGNSITISCWIKHDLSVSNKNEYIISKYGGLITISPAYAIGTGFNGDGYNWHQVTVGPPDGMEVRGKTNIHDGKWHSFISVLNMGISTAIFIDGALDSLREFPLSGSIINNLDLYFGCGANKRQYYKGCIDDIGIWNRALTQQEITDLFIGDGTPMGIESLNSKQSIKIYPNPAHDFLNIDLGIYEPSSSSQIRIINPTGQQIFQSQISQQQFRIDLSKWTAKGVYQVSITDHKGQTIVNKKFVLQ